MWHPQCFKCTHCGIPLEERNFYEKNGLPYCEKDYMDLFHPKCYGCKKPITDVSNLFKSNTFDVECGFYCFTKGSSNDCNGPSMASRMFPLYCLC